MTENLDIEVVNNSKQLPQIFSRGVVCLSNFIGPSLKNFCQICGLVILIIFENFGIIFLPAHCRSLDRHGRGTANSLARKYRDKNKRVI